MKDWKISVAVLGFGSAVWFACAGASGRMSRQQAPLSQGGMEMATLAASLVRTGIRTSMLAGEGMTVRDFVQHAQSQNAPLVIRIYSNQGELIYGALKRPAPAPDTLDPIVRQALAASEPYEEPSGLLVAPLVNEAECRSCHDEGPSRGALLLHPENFGQMEPERVAIGMAEIIHAAFERIMTVGGQSHLDAYFKELKATVPGLINSAVFSLDGKASIGDGFMTAPAEVLERAFEAGPTFATAVEDELWISTPLRNEASCLNCHDDSKDEAMRGAVISKLSLQEFVPKDAYRLVTSHSVRHVMLRGLGRILCRFLDQVAEGPLTRRVQLFDPDGRVFFDSEQQFTPPEHVAALLAGGVPSAPQAVGDSLQFSLPLVNEESCQRCHGDARKLRAVLEVEVPLAGL